MSSLITIRVPDELQIQMKRYKINWSERVRTYLETQIKQQELLSFLKKRQTAMRHEKMHADSAPLIREDRSAR
ncbi:MAG: hypothetical protein KGH67_02825 [Candidatus Micrarchaeota archaeon]|nr:hypothetical protein [Candidatus Micrarchaeota archaeon]MDE1859438.1 hypothetical protein [Candidatus Micrarchaeota archaeon]